jgi:hypothetical protein
MRSLEASLSDHPLAMLRAIAELRDLQLATNVRADVARLLAAALAEPGATAQALEGCPAEVHAAFDALRAAGGHMKVPLFTRVHGELRPVGPGRLAREAVHTQPGSATEALWYRGLIYRAFADLGDGSAEYLYIPDDLDLPALRTGSPPAPALPAPRPAPPITAQAFNALAVDACHLMGALRAEPAPLSGGEVAQDALERLEGALAIHEPGRLQLLLALAGEKGWLRSDRGRRVIDRSAVAAWLKSGLWSQMTALFEAWRGSRAWNDLRHVPSLRADGEPGNDPLLARRGVLGFLGLLEPGAWYGLAELTGWIRQSDPDYQRPDGNYSGWYLRDAGSGRYLSGYEAWDAVDGALARYLVAGPLYWLGAVALDGGPERTPASFRLTPYGHAWLAGSYPPALPRPVQLQVGEDFVVSAHPAAPLMDRFRLLRFTELAQGPYLPGRATRHRITRGSLARARESGIEVRAIMAFLDRATRSKVPSRVAAGLARWEQHGGAVRLLRGAVLRVESAATLAALRADPAIAPLLGEMLSAQAAVVREEQMPALLAALRELGYTAKIE